MTKTKKTVKNSIKRVRAVIRKNSKYRICVDKSNKHIRAQLIEHNLYEADKTLVSASSLEKEISTKLKGTGNKEAAAAVGKLLAERAKKQGIEKVAFDRSGNLYHGRVASLAQGAREGGLDF